VAAAELTLAMMDEFFFFSELQKKDEYMYMYVYI